MIEQVCLGMLDDIIVLIYLGRIIVHSGKIATYSLFANGLNRSNSNSFVEQPRT